MHHKLLLGSTALAGAAVLFASSTPAQAQLEVTLGGYTEFGAKVATDETLRDGEGASDRGYLFFMDNEVHLRAEGTSDAGVTYGSIVELEVGSGDSGDDAFIDEANLYFSGAFGRIELGRQDGAEDVMHVGGENAQAGTGGIDGDLANLIPINAGTGNGNLGDAAKATYFTPRVAGFQAGASFTPDTGDNDDGGDADFVDTTDDPLEEGDFENAISAGLNWEGAFTGLNLIVSGVGVYGENENPAVDDLADFGVGTLIDFAGLSIGLGYVMKTDFDEGNLYNAGLKYSFGPVGASIGYAYFDPDDGVEQQQFAVSADVGLMPGVTLKGDVGYTEDDDRGVPIIDDVPPPREDTWAGVLAIQVSF